MTTIDRNPAPALPGYEEETSPILLSSSLQIGKNQILEINDTTKLQNPRRTAMLIDEIRFRVQTNSVSGATSAAPVAAAYLAIGCDLRLGRLPLTNGFVPIGLFGKLLAANTGAESNEGYQFHTWKLPRPLYIPPTELLVPKFTNLPSNYFTTDGAVVVEIIYAGRSLSDRARTPPVMHVPYVASFTTTTILASGQAAVVNDASIEPQIYNPFDVPLKVQRFLGRQLIQDPNNGGGAQIAEWSGGDSVAMYGESLVTVTAVDSYGNILVRDPTPFTNLFSILDRAWTVNTQLPPKGFYLFTVSRDFTAVHRPLVAGAQHTAAISMVGYRDIPYGTDLIAPQRGQSPVQIAQTQAHRKMSLPPLPRVRR